jgi:hypothetical protein
MKACVFLILFGSFGACMAEESNSFNPQPLRFEQSAPLPTPAQLIDEAPQFRLDLPIGPFYLFGYSTTLLKSPEQGAPR